MTMGTWRIHLGIGLAGSIVLAVVGCKSTSRAPDRPTESGETAMKLTSSAFADGQPIPRKYTADGSDISPPLSWSDAPPGTAEFALIVDDPDAPVGTWDHWLLYGIPGEATSLPEGTGRKRARAEGFPEGKNSWGDVDWGGPSPPAGPAHHYHFKLYALGRKLDLKPGLSKSELLRAIKGHELGQAELVGTYGR